MNLQIFELDRDRLEWTYMDKKWQQMATDFINICRPFNFKLYSWYMDKKKVRALYFELIGYYKSAPDDKNPVRIYNVELWEQVNTVIKSLRNITGNDYDRFLFTPETPQNSRPHVQTILYRQKLAGIISYLYAEYFSDEVNPLDGSPSTIINQTQHQSQEIHFEMILKFQSEIDKKIGKYSDDSKQSKFLKMLKKSLSTIKDYFQLAKQLISLGKACGLDINEISEIFR